MKKKRNHFRDRIFKCHCWTQMIILGLGTRGLYYPLAVTIGHTELIEYLFKQYTLIKNSY